MERCAQGWVVSWIGSLVLSVTAQERICILDVSCRGVIWTHSCVQVVCAI